MTLITCVPSMSECMAVLKNCHWRVPNPGFKEILIRRMPDQAARLTAIRAGEVVVGGVSGDYLDHLRIRH